LNKKTRIYGIFQRESEEGQKKRNRERKTRMADVTYLADTNVFRYASNLLYKHQAMSFWNKVYYEVAQDQATIMICDEVAQELKVQLYTIPKEVKVINQILANVDTDTFQLPMELEYELRDFSNYMRAYYQSVLTIPGYKMNYLQASDARILVSAYMNDAVLVTANIKDFVTYLMFTDENEHRLYDVVAGQYVQIPLEGRREVEKDPVFQALNAKMKKLLV
jgi:hypothetical protein